MNYITSCPACETQFLLNTEHLKASRGKVQCGHCAQIFNAKNRLTEIPDDITSAAQYNASVDHTSIDTTAYESFTADQVFVDDHTQAVEKQAINQENPVLEKPITEVLNVVLDSVPNLSNLTSESNFTAERIEVFEPKTNTSYIDNYTPDDVDDNEIETPIAIEDLSTEPKFLPSKNKRNIWLVLLAILLAILAGLQSVYFLRDKIAAQYPQFKPYLAQACVALRCKINLLHNLELFTIDDSDMQEDENFKDVIKFSSVLINNANYSQVYPNIELTLTATDDQPVLRRLVKPIEYLKANSNVAAGIGAHEEVRINLSIHASELAVAGYRVLLVY